MAKGFQQQTAVDFKENLCPVIKLTPTSMILTLVVAFNWHFRQLDVSNVFLHGNLNVPIYMPQPPGFNDPSRPDHVCLLYRSLCGLRQAPRAWYDSLCEALQGFGPTRSKADTSLFTLHSSPDHLFVLAYVDDLVLTCSNPTLLTALTTHL